MVLFPNAKINIGLNILQKRKDGYHEIETLFYPIGLKDALEYVVNGNNEVHFTNSGIGLNIEPEQNIILKAYRLLQENFTLPGMDIHLHKVIPFGAGLGGGSSDASFFLKSVNEHLDLQLSNDDLTLFASRLGADCAFFLMNQPCLATGIGEVLTPVDFHLQGYHLLVVKPPFGVDTRLAYSGVVPQVYSNDFESVIVSGVEEWGERIKNDFESTVFARYPELGRIKQMLIDMGGVYASMSGSGSSVYALFKNRPEIGSDFFPPDYFIWQEELS